MSHILSVVVFHVSEWGLCLWFMMLGKGLSKGYLTVTRSAGRSAEKADNRRM